MWFPCDPCGVKWQDRRLRGTTVLIIQKWHNIYQYYHFCLGLCVCVRLCVCKHPDHKDQLAVFYLFIYSELVYFRLQCKHSNEVIAGKLSSPCQGCYLGDNCHFSSRLPWRWPQTPADSSSPLIGQLRLSITPEDEKISIQGEYTQSALLSSALFYTILLYSTIRNADLLTV